MYDRKTLLNKVIWGVVGLIILVVLVVVINLIIKANQPPEIQKLKTKNIAVGDKFQMDLKKIKDITDLTFDSTDPRIAYINDSGVVEGTKEGTATVKAIQKNHTLLTQKVVVGKGDGKKKDENKDTKKDETKKLELTKYKAEVPVDDVLDVTDYIKDIDSIEDEIIFKSSNDGIAKVDEEGILEAYNVGTVTVSINVPKKKMGSTLTVTVKSDTTNTSTQSSASKPSIITKPSTSKKTNTSKPKPKPKPVIPSTLRLNRTYAKLYTNYNSSVQLKPVITGNNKTVYWMSSNKGVATVTGKGVVTARNTGQATITAKLSNGKTARATISVGRLTRGIGLSGNSSVALNQRNYRLTARIYPVNSQYATIIWSSSNPSVASVSGSTTARGGTAVVNVKLNRKGTARITARVYGNPISVTSTKTIVVK